MRRTSAYGLSAWMLSSSDGVAAANLAAADWLPFLPHSYELTPHWRRKRGTCMAMLTMLVSAVVFDSERH